MALVNGSSEESFLGVPEAQRRAIVRIRGGTGAREASCTGTFVAPSWVATARHCLQIESPEVVAPDEAVGSAVLDEVAHPDLDVALLHVEAPPNDGGTVDRRPLLPASHPPRLGDRLEMAGYGITEDHMLGELRFVVEPVTAVDDSTLRVDGFGASGACEGDSGGPLLGRDPNGPVVITGILSSGSLSCRDTDTYVRVDAIRDWILGVIGTNDVIDAGCGSIDERGRCFGDSALRCEAGVLRADVCAPGTVCGWAADRAVFGCVDPAADPCAGVDSVGACRDGAALRCQRGELEREECVGCGSTCRYDAKTGVPHCSAEP
jgi:hypothetical protein